MTTYFLGGMIVGIILMWLITFIDKKYTTELHVSSMTESRMLSDGTYYSTSFYFDNGEISEIEEIEEPADDY